MSHPKFQRIVNDLRRHANRDDIDHQICLDCEEAADIVERAERLCIAIDRPAEVRSISSPYFNDIRNKREALR